MNDSSAALNPAVSTSTPVSAQSQTSGQPPKTPQFPPHNAPRVWLISNGASPISLGLSRHLLNHGDYIVLCVSPSEMAREAGDFGEFLADIKGQSERPESSAVDDTSSTPSESAAERADVNGSDHSADKSPDGDTERTNSQTTKMKPWRERIRLVPLDHSSVSQAQSAVAEALTFFNVGIDVLLISAPSAVLGSVEELSQTPATSALVRSQFETNFFANVALIKTVLPAMRERKNGHIMLLSGVTGHLGTPGISTYCASQWAMEGYCDSLAYEIAPFNIRMTIVQPNIEINVLTNKITSVPPLDAYAPDVNPAPLFRELLSNLLDKVEGVVPIEAAVPRHRSQSQSQLSASPTSVHGDLGEAPTSAGNLDGPVLTTGDLLSASSISSVYAPISLATQSTLVAETVFALAAIGGHDNPPARHIVGFEGAIAVKEKLKTVSEELEDFIEASAAVDFRRSEGEELMVGPDG